MIINLADTINSVLQSIMFVYVSNYCSKTKRSILSMATWIVILWGIIQGITLIVGNSSLGSIFIHLIILNSLNNTVGISKEWLKSDIPAALFIKYFMLSIPLHSEDLYVYLLKQL